jgi:hypothetical protein
MPDQDQDASAEKDTGQDRKPLPAASFTTFLQGLAGQCLISLGAVENPVTRKRERDLEQAKYTIDLIQIIEDRTRGNLSDDENRLLQGILYNLRMRYVDACRS